MKPQEEQRGGSLFPRKEVQTYNRCHKYRTFKKPTKKPDNDSVADTY